MVMPFCLFLVGLESFYKQSGIFGLRQQSGVKVHCIASENFKERCLYAKNKFVFKIYVHVRCSDDVFIL